MQTLHDPSRISFASDNLAGVHPEIWAAMAAAGSGHVDAYGEDEYTRGFESLCRQLFGPGTSAVPVLNGTGANVLALSAATPRWGAVVVPETAHTLTDEAGAPEHAAGLKLLAATTPDGRLTPEHLDAAATDLGNHHHAQPTTVSVANVTEQGTVYTPEQLQALTARAHEYGMLVHLDGSRLANAAAALGVSLAALTSQAGVDLLSLGATKNGAMLAEAVVVLPAAPEHLGHAVTMSRKSLLQLASKSRFVSAQLLAMYQTDLWRRNASHANAMAARLESGLIEAGHTPVRAREANAVFARLPPALVPGLRQRFDFHGEGTRHSPARLMCAFDTPAESVDAFLAAVREGSDA